jgi:predicted extracellular nuclease/uncharacterized protein YjiK/Ca2+-binding RTX toxin-like protein
MAPTVLNPGDIAFSAFQADNIGGGFNGDAFEFVLLVPVTAGTTIYFTDCGYRTDSSTFRTNEGVVRWVAQTDLLAGTIRTFTNPGGVGVASTAEWTGIAPTTGATLATATIGLATGGDNITALINPSFGGAADSLTGTAIAAITFGGATFAPTFTATSGNATTALAPGLTDGVNAVSLAGTDDGRYNDAAAGSVESGTQADVRASLNNDTFWTTSTTPLTPFNTTATFTISNGGGTTETLTLSVTPASFSEGAGANAAIGTVTRTGNTTNALTVTLVSSDTTEATVPTNVTIAAGQTSATFDIAAIEDAVVDGSQSVTLTASATNFSNATTTLTVTDNDVAAGTTRIHDIQGAAHLSLLRGQTVSNVPGIVTAIATNGFYLQDPNPDADDSTSEGIFVFTSVAPTVAVGDSLLVSGTVAEFRPGNNANNLTITQITSPAITTLSSGNPLPAAVILGNGGRAIPTTVIENDATNVETSGTFDPAQDGIDFYESLEGMLVQVNNPITTSRTNVFGTSEEIWVLADNGANASSTTARGGSLITATDFNPERIQIDDLINAGVAFPTVDVGAKLSTITGVVNYDFNNYEVLVSSAPTVVQASTLQKEVTTLTGTATQLTVATFNVENLDPGDGAAKFAGLADAIVNNLKSPDIINLEEIQDNNGPTNDSVVDASLTYQTLINAIAAAGGPTYQYRQIDPVDDTNGGEPGGNIRVGFLFNPNRVSFVDRAGGTSTSSTTVTDLGNDGTPDLSASPGLIDPTNAAFSSSRKPLVGEFLFNGQTVYVIGNHFNSKGGDQPLFGPNQPPTLASEVQRNQQATIVKNFVQSILAINPNANIVVAGDLNDFEFSNPVTILESAALNTLVETLPANERYTYNFEGNAQVLDQILASNNLLANLNGFDVVHINSEFSNQVSDHDPVLARFNLAAPNLPPSAVNLANTVTTLFENTSTATRIKVADVSITDDTSGTNVLTLSGADAGAFELDSNVLYLKAGVTLDFETKSSYAVTVNVDDAAVGNTPDASANFTLTLQDRPVEGVDLSQYVRVGRYDLPEPTRTSAPPNSVLAQEASAVTYNADTDTLFVVGDGGRAIVQVTKTGQLIDSMTLAPGNSPQGTDFYDTEGLTYIGGGKFVLIEERDRQANLFTYVPGTTLTKSNVQTVKLGTTVGNIGIEGISYDPLTNGYVAVKEISPEGIFQTGIDFAAGTATNGSPTTVNSTDLFNPALAGLADFADVYALSNLSSLGGLSEYGNLLVLSQESGKIVNIDRTGTISSSLTIAADPGNPLSVADQQHEGLTMDKNGFLYVVSENGGGDIDHPQLWVYAPASATYANQAPVAVSLSNTTPSLAENTSTATRLKVGNIIISDDALGTNNLSLSGADASAFEISGTELYLKAGILLNFELKPSYSVAVNVDDPTLGNTPDATTNFTLGVTNVNEVLPSAIISEVAPWGSGNTTYAADWFEVTNTGTSDIDLTGWKMDDNSNAFASAVALRGLTVLPVGKSAIFLEGTATGSTDAAIIANFSTAWFGTATPPSNVLIGTYGGSGVGLSTGGDAVNLFDATGDRVAGVSFGPSTTGITFDNTAGLNGTTLPLPVISALSVVGANGAFLTPQGIGSPGNINRAPSAVVVKNPINAIAENTSTVNPIKVADLTITDDGLGANTLGLTGADANAFELNGNVLYLKAGTTLDFETKSNYDVTVNVDDATVGGTPDASVNFTLAVSDANEAPSAVVLTNTVTSLAENTSNVKVADITIIDDALGTNSLSLSGNDAASFAILNNALYFVGPGDYESGKTSYAVTVSAIDSVLGSSPVSQSFALGIADVNEAPTAVNLTNTVTTLPENSSTANSIKVADIAVTDDALGTNSFSLSGTDAAFFELSGNALFVKAGTTLDFETKSNYDVTVNVDDAAVGGTPDANTNFTLALTNVNEAPVAVNDSVSTTDLQTVVIPVLANDSDVDAGDTLTIATFTNPSSGTLVKNPNNTFTYTPTVGFSGTTTFTYTVRDSSNLTATATVTIAVALANNSIVGTNGNDNLVGTSRNDTIQGLAGNDTLNGGLGNDILIGGLGNDTYIVDAGDLIVENPNEGIDSVRANLSWTLGDNLENLTLLGNAAINGTGNSLDNLLTGNNGINTLNGGAGNDTLDGGAGADILIGGLGDDIYLVGIGDAIVENPNEGNDLVRANITWTLNNNIENLTLLGTAAINGTGNGLDNTIAGNAAANILSGGGGNDTLNGGGGNDTLNGGDGNDILNGGAGADTMEGGMGDDTYIVDSAADSIIEGVSTGTDLIQSSVSWILGSEVENLTLTGGGALNGTGNNLDNAILGNNGNNVLNGGDGSDTLTGLNGNDTLLGGNGNDILIGGSGNDILAGGSGSDRFVYQAISDRNDTITDFSAVEDRLDLRGLLSSLGYLGSAPVLDGFLRFSQSGGNTLVQIDQNGNTGGANFSTLATLSGVSSSSMAIGTNILV